MQTHQLNARHLTRDLLHFNTINPPGQERDCAYFLGKILTDAGFDVKYHEFASTRTSVIATIGGKQPKPPICFAGHIDIVPLGTAAWSRDPSAGENDGDLVYGRGSTDMKSGIAAFVIAAIQLAPLLKNSPGVTLVLTVSKKSAAKVQNIWRTKNGSIASVPLWWRSRPKTIPTSVTRVSSGSRLKPSAKPRTPPCRNKAKTRF